MSSDGSSLLPLLLVVRFRLLRLLLLLVLLIKFNPPSLQLTNFWESGGGKKRIFH